MARHPQLGNPIFLVYRECPCGDWLATDAGAFAPICSKCGGRFVPGGGPKEEPAMYGRGPYHESRRIRGLGFAAIFGTEGKAMKLVDKIGGFLGIVDSESGFTHPVRSEPYFSESERQKASDEIEKAVEEDARG